MGIFDFTRGRNDHSAAEAIAQPYGDAPANPHAKSNPDLSGSDTDSSLSLAEKNEREILAHPDSITVTAQPGVQKAEAVALVWSRPALYAAYAWVWLCFFMLAFQSSVGNNVLYYAYSEFATAPAVATAQILASIIGGVIKLPIAKILNIWGRAEGFVLFVGVYLLGIIIIASCTGPSGYAAGYVLYWIGYDAIYLILDVFIADSTGLRNRPWAFAFASTPFICTAFTGPLAAQAFLDHSTWRWAYGAFAIIMPAIFLPLAGAFKYYQRKAVKMGLFNHVASGRTTWQSIVHYAHEFDIFGAVILMAAFVFFLLPFSLVTYGRASGYGSATFIAMVVIGVLLFPVFALWEKYGARVHFVRWELFRQRTVLGACCLAAILYFNFYAWDNTYYNFVMVVYNLDVSMTGYMTQIYNVGSCFWGVVIGIWMRFTKEFKWTCLCFGLPLMFLGSGLMIHFRGGEGTIGYIIMCQIFIAFSGGTLVIGEDMAVMASADRDGVPMMLSLIGLSSSIGGAIGSSVAQSIYYNTFTETLAQNLPDAEKVNATTIYLGGYLTQLTFPVGSPERDAINLAYGNTQKNGCIAAVAILILAIPAIAVWKNYRLNKQQNKGLVI